LFADERGGAPGSGPLADRLGEPHAGEWAGELRPVRRQGGRPPPGVAGRRQRRRRVVGARPRDRPRPLLGRGPAVRARVSVAVMAHRARAGMVAELVERLDRPAEVVWDTLRSEWDTGSRAWE